ncbi:MAG TPA: metallophosphatase [Deltaproteobacteria bacterium]|nr:metallophosphatase [Deltaproteobacteria bacterium]
MWILAAGVLSSACQQRLVRTAPPPSVRLVAIGDLHGDLDNALDTLRLSGVIDGSDHWSAGDATVVQTGDITDRGPDSRALIALLRRLQGEAELSGGRLVPLLGNHEVMNLVGDWRYVHPGDVEAYGGEGARRAALSPSGSDGAWLRGLDTVAVLHEVAFVHGGVSPELAALGVETLNDSVRAAIDADPFSPVLGESGPLWYREYVQDPEDVVCPRLATALQHLKATRMVVGHTTQRDGHILTRCGGALAVIDIGIADGYGGHRGAWELVSGDARARYPSGPLDLEDPR